MPSPRRVPPRNPRREGELLARIRNELGAARFAARAASLESLPAQGVGVFFAADPGNLYQFEQWRRPLEELAERIGVFVVVDRPDTGDALLARTRLPVFFARSSAQLERLVQAGDVRVVLYLNQVDPNFRMLRFPGPVHVQVGHGESDKAGSVSHQHQAYDVTLVGGAAGRERLAVLREFDVARRTRTVGRPPLDYDYPGGPPWPRGTGGHIWYAPTWEGDRPSIAYSSLVSHGPALVEALLADPAVRVSYRPHPRTGSASRAYADADRVIRRLLAAAGKRGFVDTGAYGWAWRLADACVTDVSAVAYDWLATDKPLVVTEPADRRAVLPPSPLLDALPLLPAAAAGDIVACLGAAGWGDRSGSRASWHVLREHYFGEVADRASTRRFQAAVLELAGR